ncbi:MAG: LysR family transcriptional regulator [Legionellales bacterium]|nr:LysR family transcriptional regulator [Legionellales bacterium]
MSLLNPQLQAFQAIVKYKTVHGAASAINLTQTAVTQRIRALETKLKTTLFIRTRRGMMLTSEGEALLRYCQTIREIEGETLAKIKGVGIEADIQLNIAGPTSIMRSRIIPQCVTVAKKFPRLSLRFDINDREDYCVKSIRSGENQLAIVQQQNVLPELQTKLLKPEHYVLVCTPAWKHRKLREIITNERIIDFDPSDNLTYAYLKHYNLFDLARHDRQFANRTESLALMVTEGLGYGLLSKEFSKSYLEAGELILLNSGKFYINKISLIWYERPEPPTYFSALLNAII